ncbi:hypothetical protein AYI68_g5122 [Smittium mucronatum]|uniref:Uncharacterized protein n=1 Tax=Smittium mucronatum TaxID=133383 RepID=A0A1R0GV60_9FUNG|nr:hypothetical protein AYI68_g5122 [Smittium mucronatum]
MESEEGKNTNQCKETFNRYKCYQVQKDSKTFSADILRQLDNTCVRCEVYRNNFPRITWYGGKYMDSFFKDKNSPKSNLRSICLEPSGLSEQINSTNRMFNSTGDILDSGRATRSTRYGYVSITSRQESDKILQTVSVCEIGGCSKGQTRKNYHGSNNADVGICCVVSKSNGTINIMAANLTGDQDNTRIQKLKISILREQAVAIDGMEDQRRFLEIQDLGNYAVDLILSNEQSFQRRLRYSSVQQRFLDWRIFNNITDRKSAPHIINYLAEIYTVEKPKI